MQRKWTLLSMRVNITVELIYTPVFRKENGSLNENSNSRGCCVRRSDQPSKHDVRTMYQLREFNVESVASPTTDFFC